MTHEKHPDQQANNYAFIDAQNLHAGVDSLGWKLDYKKFREYLRTEHDVKRAYLFIGFMEEHQPLYSALQEAGFILHFKPLVRHDDSTVKGNVDADMVLQTMVDFERYEQAVIISGDGDFAGLIRHLAGTGKLKQVIIPNRNTYSSLFKRLDEFGDTYFTFMNDLRGKLAYRDFNKKPRGNRSSGNHDNGNERAASAPAPEAEAAPQQPTTNGKGRRPHRSKGEGKSITKTDKLADDGLDVVIH
ncbi:NYN domain-containing protein [Candidatus Saccharibacteria bacterium]|nr:NYN domain-containing protein [Candidatus Saccharibacteria bacterium]